MELVLTLLFLSNYCLHGSEYKLTPACSKVYLLSGKNFCPFLLSLSYKSDKNWLPAPGKHTVYLKIINDY